MKQSKLQKIIKEEIQKEIISEGIVDSLLSLFIGPKIRKDVDKLKNSSEWKELWAKINTTRNEIEMYNDRFEKILKKCKEEEAYAKRKGYKLTVTCDDGDISKFRRK